MKYFEFVEPYYALIKAESKETAIDMYNEFVCDLDESLEIREVSEKEAWCKLNEAEKGFRSLEELKDDFSKNDLLLIDGSLI